MANENKKILIKSKLLDALIAGESWAFVKSTAYKKIIENHGIRKIDFLNLYDEIFENYKAINEEKKKKELETFTDDSSNIKNSLAKREQRISIAEKIAMGEPERINDQVFIPSFGERLKALEYLSKIYADFAPTKIANTNADGESIPSIIILPVSKSDKDS